jgi:hypothetical protein
MKRDMGQNVKWNQMFAPGSVRVGLDRSLLVHDGHHTLSGAFCKSEKHA